MYAVIANGSKQYRAIEGEVIKFEKLDANVGDKVEFDVLLISDDSGVKYGAEVEGLFVFWIVGHLDAWLEPVLRTADGSTAHIVAFSFFVHDLVLFVVECGSVENVVEKHSQHLGVVDDMAAERFFFFQREGTVRQRKQL